LIATAWGTEAEKNAAPKPPGRPDWIRKRRGGVITSTLLTLLVIPTVYEILADGRDWLAKRFAGSSSLTAYLTTGHRHETRRRPSLFDGLGESLARHGATR
jgi:hypothetical protein